MMDSLIFNHHSLPFNHRDAVDAAIPDFLKTCIEAKNLGHRTILVDRVVDSSWFRIELANGYFWQDWYQKNQTAGPNLDLIRAFRSIATNSPFFSLDDIKDGVELFEVNLNGNTGFSAIQAAAWHKAPLISFNTGSPWNRFLLKVSVSRINPDTYELETDNLELENFYGYSVFAENSHNLKARRQDALSSGREILTQFNELYPNVVLCGKADQQLNNWSASITILNQVKQSLAALNHFSQQWKLGEIDFYSPEILRKTGLPYKVSPESATVTNNPKLRRKREFWLPCGRQEFFEQHIKLTTGYRLHFYPEIGSRNIFVGYIGPHLPLK